MTSVIPQATNIYQSTNCISAIFGLLAISYRNITNSESLYTFIAYLNSGEWFCMSNDGSVYQGTASWTTPKGCYANP